MFLALKISQPFWIALVLPQADMHMQSTHLVQVHMVQQGAVNFTDHMLNHSDTFCFEYSLLCVALCLHAATVTAMVCLKLGTDADVMDCVITVLHRLGVSRFEMYHFQFDGAVNVTIQMHGLFTIQSFQALPFDSCTSSLI